MHPNLPLRHWTAAAQARASLLQVTDLRTNPHLQRDLGLREDARVPPRGQRTKKPRPSGTRFWEFWWVIRDLNS